MSRAFEKELSENLALWNEWTVVNVAHSLGEIVTLLANNGLRIEMLDEKRQVSWPVPFLVPLPDGEHYGWPPDQIGTLPLMYSVRARKDGVSVA